MLAKNSANSRIFGMLAIAGVTKLLTTTLIDFETLKSQRYGGFAMRTATRRYIQIRSTEVQTSLAKKNALKKIASILEDQMTEMGLSEEEKNAKTADLIAFVGDVAASKLAPHSKHSKRLNTVGLQA